MIDLLLNWGGDPATEADFVGELSRHVDAVGASARRGDKRRVKTLEAAVAGDPASSFHFDSRGHGTLRATGVELSAGRFTTPTLGELRQRLTGQRGGDRRARLRLWVLDGASPATDIGSLQATAGTGTLFQVASQFNCLESPGPYLTAVTDYFSDPTQGPRASISAWPGTLLRHYAAPHRNGSRFVQSDDGPQINLLEAVCAEGVARVRSGYLASSGIANLAAFERALAERFDDIRVGLHEDVPVMLGYNWDGGVEGERRIAQVFTSTFAGGGYSHSSKAGEHDRISETLLRAAYLGTLMAAASAGTPKVVLTLIGGGVFGNEVSTIWNTIVWALDQVEPLLGTPMDVIVNGRNLGYHVDEATLLAQTKRRAGAVIRFQREGVAVIRGTLGFDSAPSPEGTTP
ncbi:MAG: hypothetical protein JNL33_17635 [Betaproteobacteria bacterium]|nr:hypothetical protein [Betaproteobacteria bacterium]